MHYLRCYAILHLEYCKWSLVTSAYVNPEFTSFTENWQGKYQNNFSLSIGGFVIFVM